METLSRRTFLLQAGGLALSAVLPKSAGAQQPDCRVRVTIKDNYADGTPAVGETWEVRSMGQKRSLTVNRQGVAEITEEVGGRRVTRPYAELVGASDTTFRGQPAARVQIEDRDPKDRDRSIAENVIPCGQERTANVTTARKPAAQAATATPAAPTRTPIPAEVPTAAPDARATAQTRATQNAVTRQAQATATAAEARRTPVTGDQGGDQRSPRRQEDGFNWGGLLSIGGIGVMIGASALALLRLRAVRMRRLREGEEAETQTPATATRPLFIGETKGSESAPAIDELAQARQGLERARNELRSSGGGSDDGYDYLHLERRAKGLEELINSGTGTADDEKRLQETLQETRNQLGAVRSRLMADPDSAGLLREYEDARQRVKDLEAGQGGSGGFPF